MITLDTTASRAAAGSRERKRRRGLIVSVIVGSIIVHLIALALFGLWVVAEYFKEPEATFTVRKTLRIPPPPPQHRMNMARHEAMTPKPSFTDKLVSTRPVEFALPDLPKVDLDQMLPLDPSELISDQVASLVGAAGFGSGLGSGLSGGGGTGSGISFFGIRAEGERIVLLFDVSSSVVNKANAMGVPLTRIREETMSLIDGLPVTSRFSMIQFTQNYKPFNRELLAATDPNKAAARSWVENEWVESGTMSGGSVVSNPRGLAAVLELAFAMQPDLVFLISDASFQWRVGGGISDIPYRDLTNQIRDLQAGLPRPAVIHLIGFQAGDEDRGEWRRIVRRYDGEFREIKG